MSAVQEAFALVDAQPEIERDASRQDLTVLRTADTLPLESIVGESMGGIRSGLIVFRFVAEANLRSATGAERGG